MGPDFSDQYARAREMLMKCWAEEIVEIADDASRDIIQKDGTEVVNHEAIARSRLRVDTRKWLMSKLAPKKYGDRVTQQITGKDGGALEPTYTPMEAGPHGVWP